jgi:hypothetical protein
VTYLPGLAILVGVEVSGYTPTYFLATATSCHSGRRVPTITYLVEGLLDSSGRLAYPLQKIMYSKQILKDVAVFVNPPSFAPCPRQIK